MKPWVQSVALILTGLLSGCGFASIPAKSPELVVTTPEGIAYHSSGDAKVAPKVDTHSSTTVLPVTSGTPITFDTKLATYQFTTKADVNLTSHSTGVRVEGPVAFTPAAPPTVAEKGQEIRKGWLYGALFIGIAGSLFGLVETWPLLMWGGLAIAAAAYCGIFISDNPWLAKIIAFAGGVAVAGPTVYHFVIKKMTVKQP